ncbi:hypothetical protein [Lentzea sp. E54]|uniref:hypothetical protein n=1 Tax=Lentzea xerophila TaxID=3435883 RepID=UPI003DA557AE
MTYTAERLWEEAVYVAYYLHWPLDAILELEHPARVQVIKELNGIHRKINGTDEEGR